MAKYDVFISYSRKDTRQVKILIDRLKCELPDLKIWYDVDGIESAADFQSKIISAINESDVVIFACSDNSLDSEYCRKEIMYAKHKGKNIIPYLLPGAQLDGWLLFEFGTINCISSTKEEEIQRMVNDLSQWSGVSRQKQNDWADKDKNNYNDRYSSNSSSSSKSQNTQNQTQEEEQEVEETLELEYDATTCSFKIVTKTKPKAKVYINGHECVDLGLPSGLKWASMNVGAKFLHEFGDYFAWGETKPKSSYQAQNSLTYEKGSGSLRLEGYTDSYDILTKGHDAAHQNWGGSWRMPTILEIEELINNTTCVWTTIAGVKGTLVRSNVNSNSIFLPAAGWKNYNKVEYVGEYGDYWGSSASHLDKQDAIYLYNNSVGLGCHLNSRFLGFPIRPVSD